MSEKEDDGDGDGDEDIIANGPSKFLNSDRLNPSPALSPLSRPVELNDLLKRSLKPPNVLSLFKKDAVE